MKSTDQWQRFDNAVRAARAKPGVYEIKAGGILLKVGISGNIFKRLHQHLVSSQKRLKSSFPEPWEDPSQVASKGAILAKHLYFDHSIAKAYDLCSELGRAAFLREKCRVRFFETSTRDAARRKEALLEKSGNYRYVGRVVVR